MTTLLLQQMRDGERNYDRGSEESKYRDGVLKERKKSSPGTVLLRN